VNYESDVRLLSTGLQFPEGPRWWSGSLWFSDIRARAVHSLTLAGDLHQVVQLDDSPSGLGFLPDGTPLVVSMRSRLLLRIVDGGTELHADLRDVSGDFLNDMFVDDEGRAYVGSRNRSSGPRTEPLGEESAVDTIVIVDPDGSVRVGATGAISPNGTVLTPDGTLLVAETYAQRVVAYERRPNGDLVDRSVFADVPGTYPDGICLDEEGALWIASPYTDEFVRVHSGGAISERIPMIGAVACALGGPDGRSLFLLCVDPTLLAAFDAGEPSRRPRHTRSVPGRVGVTTVRFGRAGAQ
jgi:sugar lactone lactonase YvrE